MNEYLKDNLILGDWLEIFFGSITLLVVSIGFGQCRVVLTNYLVFLSILIFMAFVITP